MADGQKNFLYEAIRMRARAPPMLAPSPVTQGDACLSHKTHLTIIVADAITQAPYRRSLGHMFNASRQVTAGDIW